MKHLIFILVWLHISALSIMGNDNTFSQDTVVRTIVTTIQFDSISGREITTTTETERLIPTTVPNESKVISDGVSYGVIFSWKKKKKTFDPHWTGLGMGFMNYDDVPYGDLKTSRSHNFTFNLFEVHKQIVNTNFILVSGVGTEWSRYHFDENVALTKKEGITSFQPAPDGIEYKSTKLLVYNITIPLLLEYQVSDFHISGGAVFFLKHYSKSQVKYYDEYDHKIIQNMGRDLNIRPYDLKMRLQIGFHDIGIYAYYSPFSMFNKNKGPDVNTYTIGVMIGL